MTTRTDSLSSNGAFWEAAYTQHFGPLCTRACRLTGGDSVAAEDAVSEAFFRAMRYAPNPESIENVVSYLWTVVKRVWTAERTSPDVTRTDRLEDFRPEEIERLPGVRVAPEIIAALEREDFLLQLKTRLGRISPEENTLLDLRLQGHSLDEIAVRLGEDVQRTRFRWYRFIARKRYRFHHTKARVTAG